jgi:elongation factor Ts
MSITSALVNELRSKTGVGMMDCKKALVACNGDLAEAADWLRKQGMSSAAKKADREVNEGSVAIASNGARHVVIELSCETDFVAKNEQFQGLTRKIADHALTAGVTSLDDLLESSIEGKSVKQYIAEHVGVIGENLSLRRFACLNGSNVGSYVHNVYAPLSGKIAVLVSLDSTLSKDALEEVLRKVAMHVAAMRPIVLNEEDLDPAIISKEKEIFAEQAKASGKPDAVIEKMVDGRVRKFCEEVVLNEQLSMFDGKTKIKDLVAQYGANLGASIKINSYVRFEIGK